MPGVPLTYKTKQQILNNNDDEVAASSPVSQNRMRFWDVHFINAAVALDYGNLSRLQGEKRRQVEELAQRMREDEDDDDVEYEDEDNSVDEKEEVDIDEGDEEDETIQAATTTSSSSSSWSFLNVGSAIALWLITTTSFCLYQLQKQQQQSTSTFSFSSSIPSVSPLILSLLFFNNLNILIALCEICLGLNIAYIQGHYKKLREQYPIGNEWVACIDYLTTPLTPREVFHSHTWSTMWSTYALYDPSYQNNESFGFFIDFGNGISTIPPSIFMNVAICYPNNVSSLWVGCIGLCYYWQVMYGAIVYVFTFLFNKRYVGKRLLGVGLFVGLSNGIWIVFPSLGMYACVCMLRDGNMNVFQ